MNGTVLYSGLVLPIHGPGYITCYDEKIGSLCKMNQVEEKENIELSQAIFEQMECENESRYDGLRLLDDCQQKRELNYYHDNPQNKMLSEMLQRAEYRHWAAGYALDQDVRGIGDIQAKEEIHNQT